MCKPYKWYITILLSYSLTALTMFYAVDPILFLLIVVLPVAITVACFGLGYMWLSKMVEILKGREAIK